MTRESRTTLSEVLEGELSVEALLADVVDGDHEDNGQQVASETERLTVGSALTNDLVLKDPTVSGFHLELTAGIEGIRLRDNGSKNGTFVGSLRIQDAHVPHNTEVRVGRTTLRVRDAGRVSVPICAAEEFNNLVGKTTPVRRLMAQIKKVAAEGAAVLIEGESGTGKELVARAIHDASTRSSRPFVTVDCGALAPALVASELFGHEKGAFAGADSARKGAFERADGGTLFLNEIGELPPRLQPILLAVLERGHFRRVGGSEDIRVQARIVSSTRRDLRREVNRGGLRLDLFYRLAVVVLRVPSLRERPEDISHLVQHFVRASGYEGAIEQVFDDEAMAALNTYSWPGNVRELRNMVDSTLVMGEVPELGGQPAAPPVRASNHPDYVALRPVLGLSYREARSQVLTLFEHRYLSYWIEQCVGNVAKAAREARMDRSHLFHLLRRHELR